MANKKDPTTKTSPKRREALRNPRFTEQKAPSPAPNKDAGAGGGTLTVNAGDFVASPKGARATFDPFVPNPNLRFVYHVSYWSAGTMGMAEYDQDCLVSSWAHVQQMQADITQRLAQAGLPLANPPTIICFSLLRTQMIEPDTHTAGPAGKEGEAQV